MPTKVDQLKPEASKKEVQDAISSCIQEEMSANPGMDNKQAAAICYSKANKAMGHGSTSTKV